MLSRMYALAQSINLVIDLYILLVIAWIILTTMLSFNMLNRQQRYVMLATYYLNRLCGPPVRKLRAIMPATGQIDLTPLLFIILLGFAQNLVLTLALGKNPAIAFIMLAVTLLQLIIYILIAQMVVSLLIAFNIINRFQPFVAAIQYALESVCAPLLAPARRMLPPAGMIDFAPLVFIIALGFLKGSLLDLMFTM